MDIKLDSWLAEIMGLPVFRLQLSADERDSATPLRQHLEQQGGAFYFVKVDPERTETVRQLGTAGMFVVDTNVTFELARSPSLAGGFPGVAVAELVQGDEAAVLDVAGSVFQYSRFFLDPFVAKEVAHRIKREWIRSYVRRARGDRLLVAKIEGRPVGFLAALVTESRGKRKAVIDLIGVDSRHQRRRVGAALTQAFVDHYRDSASSLQVGTQVANIPSMRLYEQLGFSMCRVEYVLHLHVEGGRPRS